MGLVVEEVRIRAPLVAYLSICVIVIMALPFVVSVVCSSQNVYAIRYVRFAVSTLVFVECIVRNAEVKPVMEAAIKSKALNPVAEVVELRPEIMAMEKVVEGRSRRVQEQDYPDCLL